MTVMVFVFPAFSLVILSIASSGVISFPAPSAFIILVSTSISSIAQPSATPGALRTSRNSSLLLLSVKHTMAAVPGIASVPLAVLAASGASVAYLSFLVAKRFGWYSTFCASMPSGSMEVKWISGWYLAMSRSL